MARKKNLEATNTWGRTALHERSRSRRGAGVAVLLELGADPIHCGPSGTALHAAAQTCNTRNALTLLAAGVQVDALDPADLTPLEVALQQCSNIDIVNAVSFCEALLAAGAAHTARVPGYVTEIGKRFEFSRAGFNKDSVDEVGAALERLYTLFGVPPVPRRTLHGGRAPIRATAATWQEQHQELWELLVPSQGAAAPEQGEVIRISGRISREILGNGGGNWDADFDRMASKALAILASGHALPAARIAEAASLAVELRHLNGDTSRLAEMAVEWVRLNPAPVALGVVDYKR